MSFCTTIRLRSEDEADAYIAPKRVTIEVAHLKGYSNASLAKDGMQGM